MLKKMLSFVWFGTLLSYCLSCGDSNKAKTEAQKNLDTWFSQGFELQELSESNTNTGLFSFLATDKTDRDVKLYLDYDATQVDGAWKKENLEALYTAEKNNISISRQLLESLKQQNINNVSVGVTKQTIAVALFAEIAEKDLRPLLPTIHQSLVSIMQKYSNEKRDIFVKVYEPKAKAERFTAIMDKKYIRCSDKWDNQNCRMSIDILAWSKEMEQLEKFLQNANTFVFDKTGKRYYDIIIPKMDEAFLKAEEKPLRLLPQGTFHLNAENFDKIDCVFNGYKNDGLLTTQKPNSKVSCQYDLQTQSVLNLKIKDE